jgi:drug/metabolite transporter (DMT)-like permease
MTSTTKGLIAVIIAAVIGGGIPVMGKIGLSVIPPTTFTFFRFLIAAFFILPFAKPFPKITRNMLKKIFLVSLLGTSNVTLFAFGVRETTATVSQLLYAVVPVIALLLVRIIYGEQFSRKKILGVSLGFIGVLILILLPAIAKNNVFSGKLSGNLIVATAVVSFSFYSVLSKKFQESAKPAFLTFILAITTCLVMLPLAISEYLANPIWIKEIALAPIASTFYVGIMGGAVYYLLYQYAIKLGGPVIASLTLFIQPVATYLWAFMLLGEKLVPGVVIGAILTLIGARLVTIKK